MFAEEEHPEGRVPASATAGSAYLPERDEASDAGSYREDSAPAAAAKFKAPSHYDYDEGDEEEGEAADWSSPQQQQQQQDDSTIMSSESASAPPPPRAPKSTGNPLKDMLNAQITGRGGGVAAAAGAKSSSAWGEEDDEEEDDDESTARPAQKSVAAVFAAAGRPGQGQADDFSVQSSETGASAGKTSQQHATAAKHQQEEEEEEDDGDMFAANDDPFGLFGSSKPSAFTRVSTFLLK